MTEYLEIAWTLLVEWLGSLGLTEYYAEHLVQTIAAVIVYWVLRRWVVRPISRQFSGAEVRYSIRKRTEAILSVLLIVSIGWFWIDVGDETLKTLAAPLSLLGAGIAVAFSPALLNLLGWLFIMIRNPFDLQDRVQIGENGVRGDVIDVRLFMFSMLEVGNWVDADQSTGRIVHIPNAVVFTEKLANYTQGFAYIWNEIPVTVTFESDWEKAHEILSTMVAEMTADMSKDAERQVRETSTKFMVYYRRFTPIVWVSVIDIGVTLTMRYLCDPRRRRTSEHELWKAILKRFAREPGIDFAYPTQRFYDNYREGKPQAGGPPTKHGVSTALPALPDPAADPVAEAGGTIDISEPVGPPPGSKDSAADVALIDDDGRGVGEDEED